jgi:hypothetical protein
VAVVTAPELFCSEITMDRRLALRLLDMQIETYCPLLDT